MVQELKDFFKDLDSNGTLNLLKNIVIYHLLDAVTSFVPLYVAKKVKGEN